MDWLSWKGVLSLCAGVWRRGHLWGDPSESIRLMMNSQTLAWSYTEFVNFAVKKYAHVHTVTRHMCGSMYHEVNNTVLDHHKHKAKEQGQPKAETKSITGSSDWKYLLAYLHDNLQRQQNELLTLSGTSCWLFHLDFWQLVKNRSLPCQS